jgi:hypothetical protein
MVRGSKNIFRVFVYNVQKIYTISTHGKITSETNESACEIRKDISAEAAQLGNRNELPERERSAAGAASGPAAAMETPLGVIAAAVRATPGEYGEGRLAAGRRFETRRSEAG